MAILTNFLMQIAFSLGVIVVFVLIVVFCRRIFVCIAGNAGVKVLLAIGIIGTPVHELSHALACIVFGHKITDMKLYQPGSTDGTLGYVTHSYNPKNLYHQIGNFFIGIAPILGGSGLIILLMYLCTPQVFSGVIQQIKEIFALNLNTFEVVNFKALLSRFFEIIKAIFHYENMGNWRWWIFIVLSLMIAGHMELSGADMLGGLKGFVFVALILLIVDVILFFAYKPALASVTGAMVSFAATVVGFLIISALLVVVFIPVAAVIRLVIGIFGIRR